MIQYTNDNEMTEAAMAEFLDECREKHKLGELDKSTIMVLESIEGFQW